MKRELCGSLKSQSYFVFGPEQIRTNTFNLHISKYGHMSVAREIERDLAQDVFSIGGKYFLVGGSLFQQFTIGLLFFHTYISHFDTLKIKSRNTWKTYNKIIT